MLNIDWVQLVFTFYGFYIIDTYYEFKVVSSKIESRNLMMDLYEEAFHMHFPLDYFPLSNYISLNNTVYTGTAQLMYCLL